MTEWFHPAAFFIVGAVLIPFLKGRVKQVYLVLIPVIAFIVVAFMSINMAGQPEGTVLTLWQYEFLGNNLIFGKVDKLSIIFAQVFTLMAIIGNIYSLHTKDDGQHIASFLYVGSSLGVIFAGDYQTIFIFWEIMVFSSVFLVWYGRTKKSLDAGFRYLLVHTAGGLILLAGIMLRYSEVGNIEFGPITQGIVPIFSGEVSLASYLIMIGFCVNAAVPPIHAWLTDAYPEATVTGAIFLCTFTTKTAVYVLIRAFSGFEILAIVGAIMAVYGVCFTFIENDARRILSYHIISQVGYMICGIGIGSEMAVNGAVAHAYTNIIYKGLLFMGIGVVMDATGRSKLSELGGLYKYMPFILILTVIGGISISGFPMTNGFISKSMVVASAAESHKITLMLLLMLASVGTFFSVGLKLAYFIWFGKKDSGVIPKKARPNMVVAMCIAAFICIFQGIYPHSLFYFLPKPVKWDPFTMAHFSEVLQVILFSGVAFFVLRKILTPKPKINLDFDWLYRKGAKSFMWFANKPVAYTEYKFVGEIYEFIIQKPILKVASFFKAIDTYVVDGTVNGIGKGTISWSRVMKLIQSGQVHHYALIMALGILTLIAVFIIY